MKEDKKDTGDSAKVGVTTFTFGNFLVEVTLDESVIAGAIPPSLVGYILDGCTQKLQRKPASAVEKALAGYVKRPAAFKRDSIPFSAKGVAMLEASMGEAVSDVATVSVSEYVASVTDAKYTYEKGLIAEKVGAGGSVAAIASKVGFEGETDGENDGFSTEFLRALRNFVEAARKSAI